MEETNFRTKIESFFNRYIVYIVVVLIVVILLILLFPKNDIKSKVIRKLNVYLNNNNITLNNIEREFSFKEIGYELSDNCYEGGLVVASINNYKVYYICDMEPSDDLKTLLRKNNLPLYGNNPTFIKSGLKYEDAGYYKNDPNLIVNKEGNVTSNVGMYLLKYNGYSNNLSLSSTRVVMVTNKRFESAPTITLKGGNSINLLMGDTYVEPGFTASDNFDGDLTYKVNISNQVNPNAIGKYILKYQVINS